MANYATPERIQEVTTGFQGELAALGATAVRNLPDLTGTIDHTGRPSEPVLMPDPAIYIDHQVLGIRPEAGVVDWKFGLKPGNRVGREDSHRAVVMGYLSARDVGHGQGVSREVAVKPGFEHPDSVQESLREVAMYQYMGSLGIPTFRPVGLQVGETKLNHIITDFRSGVKTMDTIEWHKLDHDEMWAQAGLATNALALLHANLLAHHDFYFRNAAFDDAGSPVIVDPEFMVSVREFAELLHGAPKELDGPQQIVFDKLVRHFSSDFSYLTESVGIHVIDTMYPTKKPSDGARFKLYKKHLYEPYGRVLRENLESSNSPHADIVMRAYRAMVSRKKELAKQGIV